MRKAFFGRVSLIQEMTSHVRCKIERGRQTRLLKAHGNTKINASCFADSDKSTEASVKMIQNKRVKMLPISEIAGNRVLLKNTYMVEFGPESADRNHFRTVTRSLQTSHNIQPSTIKRRCDIRSKLFSGVSFTVTTEHSVEAIETIQGAIAVYPVYIIHAPDSMKNSISSDFIDWSSIDWIHPSNLTSVSQVHEKFQNFGKGVRVREISSI